MALQMTSAGLLGFAPQTAFEAAGNTFYWFPMVNCGYGPMEGQDNLPWEVGGAALPRGRFKTGVVFGGNVDMIPRIDCDIGWLLHGAIGDCSKHAGVTIAQHIAAAGTNVGVDTYHFYYNTDHFAIKYFTTHKLLPHGTAASQVGEIGEDVRITNLTITATPAAVVAMRMGLLGRATASTVWDLDPGYTATYDDDETFLVTSCSGDVQIEDSSYDTGAVVMTMANNVLPPARARKIGSGHPIDFPVLSRSMTFVTTCYVADYDLYMQTFGGAATPVVDCGWSCVPYSGDIDVTLQSAKAIPSAATAAYYQLRIRTTQNNVNFMARPIVLVPNQPVVFQLIGNVQDCDVSNPFDVYFQTDANLCAETLDTWPT